MLLLPGRVIGLERGQQGGRRGSVEVHEKPGVTPIGKPGAVAARAVLAREPEADVVVQVGAILQPPAFVEMMPQRARRDAVAAAFVDRPALQLRVPSEVLAIAPPAIIVDVSDVLVRALEEGDVVQEPLVVPAPVGIQDGGPIEQGWGRWSSRSRSPNCAQRNGREHRAQQAKHEVSRHKLMIQGQ